MATAQWKTGKLQGLLAAVNISVEILCSLIKRIRSCRSEKHYVANISKKEDLSRCDNRTKTGPAHALHISVRESILYPRQCHFMMTTLSCPFFLIRPIVNNAGLLCF